MAEVRSRRALGLGAGALLAALAACVPSPPAAAPAPGPVAPLSPDGTETVARLLMAEDRREYPDALVREAAAWPDTRVRARTALAVGRLRSPAGAPILLGLLADPDSSVAATAAFALGQSGDTAAVPVLVELLSGEASAARPTVAAEAAYALGKLGTAPAHAALAELLSRGEAPPPEVVGSALLAIWRFPRGGGIEPIGRWAEAEDPELRWRAVYALSRRPDPAASALLLRAADDRDPRVRALALRGLTAPLADSAGLGAASVLPAVLEAAADSAYPVRINAIRALATYRDPRAVAALSGLLAAPDRHAALAAAEGLGRLGPQAAAAAASLESLALAQTAPLALRQEALLALAAVDSAAGHRAALRLSGEGEWRLRAGAGRALAALAGPGSPEVLASLRDPDGRVSAATLQALLDRAGDDPAPLRLRLLEGLGSADPLVRAAALGGLARLRDPSTLPLLLDAYERALADPVNDAALAAVDALATLVPAGSGAGRAFFARFSRPADPRVRLRVRERFGARADSAWGAPLPVETGRPLDDYLGRVERWIAPPPEARADPEVEIVTDSGTIRLRLFASEAPLTVENLVRLADAGYFDGQEWPRVVPNFVVQGGDPRGDTGGGPGYAIRDEINRLRYVTGSVGMALSGPDTGGSQFFLAHSPQPHLDGIYTLFGEVVEGAGVAESLLPGDRIRTVRVLNR